MRWFPALAFLLASGVAAAWAAEEEKRFGGQTRAGWRAVLQADTDARARRAAAFALGELGPAAEDVTALAAALRDKDANVRRHAALALGRAGAAALDPLIAALGAEQAETRRLASLAAQGIGPAAAPLAPRLAEALQDKDFNVQRQAAGALAKVGKPAVSALSAALKEGGSRRLAAAALGEIGPAAAGAAPLLREALKGDDASLAQAAAVALLRVAPGDEAALAHLVKALARRGVADSGEVNIEGDLLNAARGEAAAEEAAEALGRVGKAAAAPLVTALRERGGAKFMLVRALGKVGPDAAECVPDLVALAVEGRGEQYLAQECHAALLEIGPAAVKPLLKALAKPGKGRDADEARLLAVHFLGRLGFGVKEAVAPLRAIAADKEAGDALRFEALEALGRLGPVAAADAVPLLLAALRDRTAAGRYRLRAAVAFSRLGPAAAEAVPDLLALRRVLDREDEAALDQAVLRLGAAAVEPLLKVVGQDDVARQAEAVEQLGRLGPAAKPARPALVELLGSDKLQTRTYLRPRAIVALGQIGDPAAAEPLAKLLTGRLEDAERVAVVVALGRLKQPATVSALVLALKGKDAKLRGAAAGALSKLGPQAREAAEALTATLDDDEGGVRIEAAVALGEIGPAAKGSAARLAVMAAKDRFWDARACAALAASQVLKETPEEACEALIALTKDSSSKARSAAAVFLEDLGPAARPAVPALEALLDDRDPVVSLAAAMALVRVRPEAAGPRLLRLVEALDSGRAYPHALGHLGPVAAPALPALLDLTRRHEARFDATAQQVARSALEAIEQISPAHAAPLRRPVLLASLRAEDDPGERQEAAKQLGKLGAQAKWAVEPLLAAAVENPTGAVVYAEALRQIDPDAARRLDD
jgi:HEAT repeat protein